MAYKHTFVHFYYDVNILEKNIASRVLPGKAKYFIFKHL